LHDSLDVNNLAIDAYYLHGSLSRREWPSYWSLLFI
jgi:hypothetical protein